MLKTKILPIKTTKLAQIDTTNSIATTAPLLMHSKALLSSLKKKSFFNKIFRKSWFFQQNGRNFNTNLRKKYPFGMSRSSMATNCEISVSGYNNLAQANEPGALITVALNKYWGQAPKLQKRWIEFFQKIIFQKITSYKWQTPPPRCNWKYNEKWA